MTICLKMSGHIVTFSILNFNYYNFKKYFTIVNKIREMHKTYMYKLKRTEVTEKYKTLKQPIGSIIRLSYPLYSYRMNKVSGRSNLTFYFILTLL